MHTLVKAATAAAAALGMVTGGSAQTAPVAPTPQASPTVFYRSVSVDGLSIFYREAGPADAPKLQSATSPRPPRDNTPTVTAESAPSLIKVG